jgi:hypothetical protein
MDTGQGGAPEEAATVVKLADDIGREDIAHEDIAHEDIGHEDIGHEDIAQEDPARRAQPAPREVARKTGRPSVPAWDEIMFGSRPGAGRSSS